MHIVWVILIAYMFWIGSQGREIELLGKRIWIPNYTPFSSGNDAIQSAAELGRLDVISISLAILGVALALAALSSFFVVRHAAIQAASIEAKAATEASLPNLITAEIVSKAIQNNPYVLKEAMDLIRESENGLQDQDANAIAETVYTGEIDE